MAGPFTTTRLADFGAEVIKGETPGKGDPMREWGHHRYKGKCLWWPVLARNKKSVTANLRETRGQDLVKGLAAKADVLARLELLKAALEAEQGKIAQMKLDHQAEVTGLCDALEQSRDEVSACRETIAGLQESLEGAKRSLEEERQNLARALREFAADIERINQQHEASMAQLQAKLDHEVKEKETVAQQLVGKIRQLRIERERADDAEC